MFSNCFNGKKSSNKTAKGSRHVAVYEPEVNEQVKFCNNSVITSKYTVVSFLPLFMLEAFQKFANTYFLIVSILQIIPAISTTDGVPFSLLPLCVVLVIEAIASAVEDYQRHVDDENANSSTSLTIAADGTIVPKKWRELKVGDIIKIRNREQIPADCVIVAASDDPPAAVCYVETKSLDGETNLKLRQGIVRIAELVAAKTKEAPQTNAKNSHPMDYAVSKLRGFVDCEQPNPHIDNFDGVAQFGLGSYESEEKVPLTLKNILLRGCVVRSTDFVYGLIVNTGHETKIVQSTTKTKGKMSELDRAINKNIVGFLVLELGLCVLGAVLASSWSRTAAADGWYYRDPSKSATFTTTDGVIRFFTFFLLLANMIPISLFVAMKFSRFFQGFFIYWDLEMRYQAIDPMTGDDLDVPAKARTMDLNDSLGQISYIFSDKTGTLTNNIMEFRKFSVAGFSCGLGNTIIGIAALEREGKMREAQAAREMLARDTRTPHPRFICYNDRPDFPIGAALSGKQTKVTAAQLQKTKDFFTVLAICHSVLVEQIRDDDGRDTGKVRFSASSPDDQALVVAAQEFGFRFTGRGDGGRTVLVEQGPPSTYIGNPSQYDPRAPAEAQQQKGKLASFETLEILEFTSTRKRMSVIFRDPSGTLRLACKGADSELLKRLNASEKASQMCKDTNNHLTGFADDGLRTLVIGWKTLDVGMYQAWSQKYKAASTDVGELEKRKNKQKNLIDDLMDEIEADLELLGATAIEDKLQDGVPETIAKLADAGIKIWVLTGDKQETAINIGFACQLLDRSMKRILINESSAKDTASMINVLNSSLAEAEQDRLNARSMSNKKLGENDALNMGLVIDGAALKIALEKECRGLLLKLARQCKAVIACRVSPKQKAEMVELVRLGEKNAKTLSIGDGANDVPMIQTAHIGVGISGQEGLQAVNASDFAIAQFRYLQRLILVHGRNNYRRLAKLVVVMFYKNVQLILAQLYLSYFNGYSGQKFYFQLATELFNLIYSNLIIFCIAVFDKDLPDRLLLKYPTLYEIGLKGQLFNVKVFWGWVINGVYHSIFAFFIPWAMFMQRDEMDLWAFGCIVFTAIVFIANLKISLEQGSWALFNFIMWFVTLLSWPLTALIFDSNVFIDYAFGWEWFYTFSYTFKRLDNYAVLAVTIIAALIRDYAWKAWRREVYPRTAHIIQEIEYLRVRAGGKEDDIIVDVPGLGDIEDVKVTQDIENGTKITIEVPNLDENYDRAKHDEEIEKTAANAVEISYKTSGQVSPSNTVSMIIPSSGAELEKDVKPSTEYKGYSYAEDDQTSTERRASMSKLRASTGGAGPSAASD